MNLEHYEYKASADFSSYVFFSEGPKGKIKKVVTFAKIPNIDITVFALAFGDLDPETGGVNDKITTNNGDRDIVLATVANTVIAFCNTSGNHFIFAEGSTKSRTRLYRICISKYLDEITQDFEVFGVINDQYFVFQKNVDYDGFLVKRKF
jgi:hypothetical protein